MNLSKRTAMLSKKLKNTVESFQMKYFQNLEISASDFTDWKPIFMKF